MQELSFKPLHLSEKTSLRIKAFFHRFMLIFTLIYIIPFVQVYFELYIPFLRMTPLINYISWIMGKIFGSKYTIHTLTPDSYFYYVYFFLAVIITIICTLPWTIVHPGSNERISWWWSNILRICLASLLFFYGIFKVLPVQMPEPNEIQLMLRLIDLSPMDYLWKMMGFSPAYEMITGWIEVLGAVFTLIPRLITIGGLINLIVILQVGLLNYCYDVPVKLAITWMGLAEIILLFPFLKKFSLYLFGKIELPRLERKRIISVKSIFLRRAFIAIYCLSIIYVIGRASINFVNIYKATFNPKPAIAGAWVIRSIKSPSLENQSEYLRLHVPSWEIIAISPADDNAHLALSIFSRVEQIGNWTASYQPNTHHLSWDDPTHQEKFTAYYAIAPTTSQKLSEHSQEQTITFTIYVDKAIKPSFIIQARRYPLSKHHPGEFHWIQEKIPQH